MYSDRRINFIASFPKAGTHLMAWILGELGLEDTKWQIGYDFINLTDSNDGRLLYHDLPGDCLNGVNRRVAVDRNQIMRLIKTQQFSVGHLPPHVLDPDLHFRLKTILLVRNLKDSLLSYYNYYRLLVPEDPDFAPFADIDDPAVQMELFLKKSMPQLIVLWRDLMAWKLYRSNIVVTYENLKSTENQSLVICRIAKHFGIDVSGDGIETILRKFPNSSTPTKLLVPRELRPGQWSEGCEELYHRFGCGLLDKEIADYIAAGY